jgi:hypothetical protein
VALKSFGWFETGDSYDPSHMPVNSLLLIQRKRSETNIVKKLYIYNRRHPCWCADYENVFILVNSTVRSNT